MLKAWVVNRSRETRQVSFPGVTTRNERVARMDERTWTAERGHILASIGVVT